jgi:hypothetical protein
MGRFTKNFHVLIRVSAPTFSEVTKRKQDKPQSGYSAVGSQLCPETSKTRSRYTILTSVGSKFNY